MLADETWHNRQDQVSFDSELTPQDATRDSEYHAGAGVIVECFEYQERPCPDPAAAF